MHGKYVFSKIGPKMADFFGKHISKYREKSIIAHFCPGYKKKTRMKHVHIRIFIELLCIIYIFISVQNIVIVVCKFF